MDFDSFIKALRAFFTTPDRGLTIPEIKELTTEDKLELSNMLNATPGYTHPTYKPVQV